MKEFLDKDFILETASARSTWILNGTPMNPYVEGDELLGSGVLPVQ